MEDVGWGLSAGDGGVLDIKQGRRRGVLARVRERGVEGGGGRRGGRETDSGGRQRRVEGGGRGVRGRGVPL